MAAKRDSAHSATPGDGRPAPVPKSSDLRKIREAAATCTACPLYRNATQTVFGEGPRHSLAVFVGEQPGDLEDLRGKPFVGPAGQILDRALTEVGIERQTIYVTNAVKHFKWEPRGKRRLHKTPSSRDIAACRPWLETEIAIIKPKVLVCLGATAAKTIMGPAARVMRDRGKMLVTPFSDQTLLTVHPSSLLRAPDEESRRANYALFIADLKIVANALHGPNSRSTRRGAGASAWRTFGRRFDGKCGRCDADSNILLDSCWRSSSRSGNNANKNINQI